MSEEVKQQTEQPESEGQASQGFVRNKKAGGRPKRKICAFCMGKDKAIDYKDVARLRKYISEKGKIVSRRTTGLCSLHQREVTNAIKRARAMSLI